VDVKEGTKLSKNILSEIKPWRGNSGYVWL